MKKLNVFISYSHLDEDEINEFKKHVSPLQTNGLIEIWYDRKIVPGAELQDKITDNLKNSDIVCLFISANFLSSAACCSGLIEPDTLIRDNNKQLLRCHNGTETNIQTIF